MNIEETMNKRDLNNLVNQLEKKIKEIETKRENLLIDFVHNLDLSNLKQVELYSEADRLLEKALQYINKRLNQIILAIEEK